MNDNHIKVALADDHELFRAGIKSILDNAPGLQVTLEAQNGQVLIDQLSRSTALPDVILMDIRMPEKDGFSTAEKVIELYPSIKIIVLSMHQEERHIIRMIELGVNGYLLKNSDPSTLILSIKHVMENDYYFSDLITNLMRKVMMFKGKSHHVGSPIIRLTDREKEVLTLICEAYTAKEIAQKLYISYRTVEGHRKNLLSKLAVKNTAGLVVFAIKNELVNL